MTNGAEEEKASDRSLLKRIEAGESDAALALYLRYARRLHGLATRQTGEDLAHVFDPDDIVQSVFRTFFRRASAGLYDIPEGDELWRLFLVIALNKVRKRAGYHRAAKRDVRATSRIEDVSHDLPDYSVQADNAVQILRMTVDDELATLTPSESRVVTLRIEGHTIREISAETGRARRTVERILQNFRQRLRLSIGEGTSDGE